MNRRTLLQLVGRAGGTAAVLTTLNALGLLPATSTERPTLAPNSGEGLTVAILGAGVAGMCAAYELTKAGYTCTLLEARDRAGGRCWSLRGGDTITEIDSTQTCAFDRAEHLYLNPGPARIPHHHRALLSYCKEFGVPLEVIVNDNRAAYFQDDDAFKSEPVLNRRVLNDSRGYIAELLAKALSKNALEQDLTSDDQERLLALVQSFGSLNDDYRYTGTSRAGYTTPPGGGLLSGEPTPPLPLADLLRSRFWNYKTSFAEGYNQSATMLEPIGGMDQIAKAFERQVGSLITYSATITQIRKTPSGVQIQYTDATNSSQSLEADFTICTLPLSVLSNIPSDFSPPVQQAIAVGATRYVKAMKIAFQSRRFWEDDYHIYGGISWTERDITQIWYPASSFHAEQGIIVGAYIWSNDIGDRLGALSLADRLQQAIIDGEAVHPGTYRREISPDRGVSIAWDKIPYSQGGWIEWEDEDRTSVYPALTQPDDRIYFAGEHISYLTGWQEGAILSAHQAVEGIATQQQAIAA